MFLTTKETKEPEGIRKYPFAVGKKIFGRIP